MLYDLCSELIRKGQFSEDVKAGYRQRLDTLKVTEGVHIYNWDSYYHRNITNVLQVEVETAEGFTITVQQINFHVKRLIADITEILSDVADYYYMDFTLRGDDEESGDMVL